MLGNLGFTEIMIIMVVVLLFFGAKRLPEIGQSMGKGIREFQRSFKDTQDAVINPPADDRTTKRMLDGADDAPPTGGEPKRLSQ
jgi:sec-independent protein translocase protein TatA